MDISLIFFSWTVMSLNLRLFKWQVGFQTDARASGLYFEVCLCRPSQSSPDTCPRQWSAVCPPHPPPQHNHVRKALHLCQSKSNPALQNSISPTMSQVEQFSCILKLCFPLFCNSFDSFFYWVVGSCLIDWTGSLPSKALSLNTYKHFSSLVI